MISPVALTKASGTAREIPRPAYGPTLSPGRKPKAVSRHHRPNVFLSFISPSLYGSLSTIIVGHSNFRVPVMKTFDKYSLTDSLITLL